MTESYMDVLEDRADQEECYAWAVYEIKRLRKIEASFLNLMKENSRQRHDIMLLNSRLQTEHEIIRIKEGK